jgi:hypothetical protein
MNWNKRYTLLVWLHSRQRLLLLAYCKLLHFKISHGGTMNDALLCILVLDLAIALTATINIIGRQ